MLDYIYDMTLKLLLSLISVIQTLSLCHYVPDVVMDVIMFTKNM